MARNNNNNKLKAFVRFDGSGRIIPSSLIVQAFKPKVGNYQEIDAKECCNYTPTTTSTTTVAPTTTTSTTVAPTTTTTTTSYYYYLANGYNCSDCSTVIGTDVLIYGTNPSLTAGQWVVNGAGFAFEILSSTTNTGGAIFIDMSSPSESCAGGCPTTTTTTTTVEPVTNLFIFNTSTGDASVSALTDNSGPISLTNQNGSLPVLASQTMDAIHGATDATPRATISGTGTITFQIILNGAILNVGTVSIPTDIGLTPGNVPLLASDVVRITLYNPT